MIGPGLAKAGAAPLVLARRKVLLRGSDAAWRELVERADILSEGRVREEPQGQVWYGSTILLLAVGKARAPLIAAIAQKDVHFRLRAMRTAHREASIRAPSPLGRLTCDIRVASDGAAVRIDVDVQAPLLQKDLVQAPAIPP